MDVREDNAKLRRQFSKLEEDRRGANSIRTRQKIRKAQRQLLEAAARSFEHPSCISLETVIRVILDLASAGAGKSIPKEAISKLLSQPVEQLVSWWQRRPISSFFKVANKVRNIKSYDGLLEKLFPNSELQDKPTKASWRAYLGVAVRDGKKTKE